MIDPSLPPWEAISPFLTEARLVAVAEIIRSQRDAKIAQRQPPDCNWNVGCDCFQWQCWGIRRAAEGEHAEWLHVPVAESDLDFLFQIGGPSGVPVKFFREESQGQPYRSLHPNLSELLALQLAFEFDNAFEPENFLRLAITTHPDGRTSGVTLAQYDVEGQPTYRWPIPLAEATVESVPTVALGEALQRPGVDLGEPEVRTHEERQAEAEDEEKEKEEGRGRGA